MGDAMERIETPRWMLDIGPCRFGTREEARGLRPLARAGVEPLRHPVRRPHWSRAKTSTQIVPR